MKSWGPTTSRPPKTGPANRRSEKLVHLRKKKKNRRG